MYESANFWSANNSSDNERNNLSSADKFFEFKMPKLSKCPVFRADIYNNWVVVL